ncbi:MAG: bifunctional tRNA (adenosine(37)-N6)-threonylcarbamoyltransferase complex ATPase subunit type 1 TsaE/phosphotransferase, partial [Pelagibacterales bacterium]|nr:bifunctional tRNA (adenosine(37)-N6)-threonylcarbamoyltransferase complex ATPase subunit type 1 TsaE/phosphotransferase [Pelagibacterales bacterium]
MNLGKFHLNSVSRTKNIAYNLSKLSKAGDMFALYGEIGVGKTTFAKYFINQAAEKVMVPSPSYNIYFRYEC